PFDRYLAAIRAADPADYPAVAPAEVERMRDYLLRYYDGVRPVGTHLDPSGATVDCVPFEQFPTVRAARAAGIDVAQTAPRPTGSAPGPATAAGPHSTPAAIWPHSPCPAGHIPVARLTLDDLVRHGSLDRFLAPPGKGPVPTPESAGPGPRPG
ncbi:MAG TPA: hypothetical protein VH092_26000, partial [Urbifossiella sp.]|nr:hypothetical protein [Urbifossiella sp.]